MSFIFWACIFALFYIYLGYPILIRLIRKLVGCKVVQKNGFEPQVTLIISAYNEEESIREKIENSLSLDYPSEKLEILIISDASSDATDQIVSEYEDRGVTLVRMEARGGKTSGLNHGVSVAKGEVIVFSDANAFYEPDSVRRLAEHFSDPEVGYVTGASRYIQKKQSFVGRCENLYWNYDLDIKQVESDLGSMIGADGAMYAIRRVLYTPLKPQDINDFLNPLQIIAKGYRGIFEPSAICREETVSKFGEEYRRKVRIVSRSLRCLMQVSVLLNPFRFGLYSLQLFSHKLLRWFTPLFIFGIALSNIWLWEKGGIYLWVGVAQLVCYGMALAGYLFSLAGVRLRLFFLPYYFCLMNVASLHAIWKSARGEVQATWEPEREKHQNKQEKRKIGLSVGIVLIGLFIIVQAFSYLGRGTVIEEKLFWVVTGLLIYALVGYIASLSIISLLVKPFKKPKADANNYTPSVTLMISAYNEEKVIESKIKNSLDLDYPSEKLRILVVSDGSTDETEVICNAYANRGITLWSYHPRRGKISIINRAMQRIEDEIVVLSDANVLYEADAIKLLVKHFTNPTVGAVSGKVSVVNAPSRIGFMELIYQKYENYIKEQETLIGSITGVDGAMYAIRQQDYDEVPENVILDDLVISMNIARRGKRILFEPAAKGIEPAAVTVKEGFGARVRVIAGAIQAMKQRSAFPLFSQPFLVYKFISHKILRWLMPLLLIALFILNFMLMEQSLYLVLFVTQLAFYTLALIGWITKQSLFVFSVPFYFCMQNVAAMVGIWRGLTDTQSVMWDKAERYVAENDGVSLDER